MNTPLSYQTGRLAVAVTDQDHIRGPIDASVTLVEYGDFQCPYCGMAHPAVEELLQRRPTTVRLVFRHFPIANVHPYAQMAAEVSESAGERDRFWEIHDWLFENQQLIDPEALPMAAGKLGLPVDAVVKELAEHRHADRVRRDFVGGVHSGVNGTPTFFVNDVRHDGGFTVAELIEAVDEAAAAWPTGHAHTDPG